MTSEGYAEPADAKQEAGPRPLGASVQDPEGQIQTDFDGVMQSTYLKGHIYGELNTATTGGNDAAAWFILTPKWAGSTLSATIGHQGYVAPQGVSVLYPVTALDDSGHGFMAFAVSGRTDYPSAAYLSFGPHGPSGPVRIAAAGAAPEDSFTCYPAFVGPSYGGCRWGDYSMGVASGGHVYLATEMVPPSSRDYLTNWGTYIWTAPARVQDPTLTGRHIVSTVPGPAPGGAVTAGAITPPEPLRVPQKMCSADDTSPKLKVA